MPKPTKAQLIAQLDRLADAAWMVHIGRDLGREELDQRMRDLDIERRRARALLESYA